jgi:predicted Zn-dependent protease
MQPRFFAIAFASLIHASMAVLAPGLSYAQNLPNLGDTAREELSPQMEYKLGERIMRDIRRDRDFLDDAPLLEYLRNFGNSLLSATPEARGEAGYDYFFFAVRDPMLNAFALPGGFIGLHSGLLLAAQNESELASVMAHEIGHVSQRHIARMLGKQKQDALIPLAAMLLAALASRASPDAGSAVLMGGQGLALQRQLGFSRDAEREADRVGLQIMNEAGFDTSGMVAFFGRLQNASRAYNDVAPAFLRSHPLTTERMADIDGRLRDMRQRPRVDSLDFHLIRARVRVLQDPSGKGLQEASGVFNGQLRTNEPGQVAAAKYGLALVAFRRGEYADAHALLGQARDAALQAPASSQTATYGAFLAHLAVDIMLAWGRHDDALREAHAAQAAYPLSRGIAYQYAHALIRAGRHDDAVTFLRDQTQLYRTEPQLQDLLARAYAAKGSRALQHLALAESYALSGSLPAALDQLAIARKAPDASFYDQAVADAREREFRARWREELQAQDK